METLDPQSISNVVWAFSEMEYFPRNNLLELMDNTTARRIEVMGTQELSFVTWAFARGTREGLCLERDCA